MMEFTIPGGQRVEFGENALVHHQLRQVTLFPYSNIASVKHKKKVLVGYDTVELTMTSGTKVKWHVVKAAEFVDQLNLARVG